MSFGDRLKEARRARGLTQEQLAIGIGVAKSTLTGYEKGTREPDVFKIKRIIEILEIDSDYLLGIEQCKKNAPTTQQVAEAVDILLYAYYGRPATIEEIDKFAALFSFIRQEFNSNE